MWTPFLAWADKIVSRVSDKRRSNDESFQDRLFLKASADKASLERFLEMARGLSSDVIDFKKQLDEVDALSQDLGEMNVIKRKARIAVDEISSARDYAQALLSSHLISKPEYNWHAVGWKNVLRTGPWLLLMALLLSLAMLNFSGPRWRIDYYTWRLGKPNASREDQFRARERLSAYLSDDALTEPTFTKIGIELRRPGYSMDRVGAFVAVLLQHRHNPKWAREFPSMLVEALRADSVDVRTRVQSALMLLAHEQNPVPQLSTSLKDWKPADGDPIDQLEEHIAEWRTRFGLQPESH